MLFEITNVKQFDGENAKRWFTDKYWDLYIWLDKDDNITEFQLCYDKTKKERALNWSEDGGYRHTKVDDGELPGRMTMTPILVLDGVFKYQEIAHKFKMDSTGIDRKVADFVYEKILEFRLN